MPKDRRNENRCEHGGDGKEKKTQFRLKCLNKGETREKEVPMEKDQSRKDINTRTL